MNLKDLFWFKEPAANTEFKIEEEKRKTDYDVREEREAEKDFYVTENYDENLSYIKRRFSVPMNYALFWNQCHCIGNSKEHLQV